MPMAVLNGELVPAASVALAPTDAGVVFGATVTDYCRTFGGKLFRYPLHVERLRRDCAACFVPFLQADERLIELAEELVRLNGPGDLALITFATPGPLASMGGSGAPTLVMHTFPIPSARYRPFFTEGVHLMPFDGSPVFPSAKHRSRLPWWRAAHLAEGVPLLVADGTVCETAIGNVLLARGDEIVAAPPRLVLDGLSQRITREMYELSAPSAAALARSPLDRRRPDRRRRGAA
ncbi:MAG: aminotransferase class IV, partial [Gemmataceae bacterium]|nr:aminotransferase class IV [Gemmataceae bacterium]